MLGFFFLVHAVLYAMLVYPAQVPGGRLAESLGSRRVLGVATLASSLLTLLCPAAALWGLPWLVGVRILLGLAQGVLFPCINPVVVK